MSVLKKYVPSRPLSPENIAAIEGRLRRALAGRVDEAFIFGSVGTGSYKSDSDIDLILIQNSALPFAARGKEFLDLFAIHPDLDILVYSRPEFDARLATPGPGFWNSVRETSRQLL